MAGEKDKDKAPIVVKRIKKGGHGFHGGVWKIAYADFVTAMMAFFLLMWVLGSTTRGDLAGISAYFQNPLRVAVDGGAGSGDSTSIIKGGGKDIFRSQGQESSADSNTTQRNKATAANDDEEARKFQYDSKGKVEGSSRGDPKGQGNASGGGAGQGQGQAQQQVKQEIEKAVKSDPELQKIQNQLFMDVTSDGLRMQIVDEKNRPMFDSGSTGLNDHIRRLMRIVGKVVGETNFAIRVEGHTDAKGFGSDAGRGNWELSTERANAARREMISGGLRPDQVAQVVGYADKIKLNPDDPSDPLNRRISITVLSNTVAGPKSRAPGTGASDAAAAGANGAAPAPGAAAGAASGAPAAGGAMPGAAQAMPGAASGAAGQNAAAAPTAGGAAPVSPTQPDSAPPMAIRPELKREILEAARRAGGINLPAPLPAGARGTREH